VSGYAFPVIEEQGQELKTMTARTNWGLAILSAAGFFLSSASSLCSANPAEDVKSASPLNEQNLATILDNRGKFTEPDLTKMLGPASSVETHAAFPGVVRMNWHDVTRIEVKCREGVVESVTGTFSPRLPSRIINYAAFTKLRAGMKANDILREFFVGWPPEIVKDPAGGTVTLVYEQYNRFWIDLRDGKVQSALRKWHTDEHLNTPAE
jgi:hypothetical protein